MYYALIHPHLIYGILAWECTSKTRLDCFRTIFFAHPRESVATFFKLLTVLKLDNNIYIKNMLPYT